MLIQGMHQVSSPPHGDQEDGILINEFRHERRKVDEGRNGDGS